MGLHRALQLAPWRVGDASSQLMLDIAAGRPLELHRPLNRDELALAVRHGLFGLMADHENPILRAAGLPVFARLAARHGVMNHHTRRLLTTLHTADIPATVLKGSHLATWAYRNPAHRTTTDIDILVPRHEIDRAIEVVAADEAVEIIPPKTPKADKRNIPVADPSGVRFTLDLHWDLFSYTQLRGCAEGATGWAWDNATLQPDHPLGPMWQLPEEARIGFLCTHALLDHRFRLILFRDLTEVAATEPDWSALIEFGTRWQLRAPTYLALLMAVGLTEAAVPPSVLEKLRLPHVLALRYLERMLPRTNTVRFDGHRLHPLNLAAVLVHDDRRQRLRLAADAPLSFPTWWKRVEAMGHQDSIPAPDASRTILLLVASDRRRGAEVFGERLAEGLRQRNWTVDFVALDATGASPVVNAAPLTADGSSGRIESGVVRELRKRIRRTRPALVLANGGTTLRYAAFGVAGLRNRPRLAYASVGEPAYWLRGNRHRLLQAILHRRADLILAVSAATRRQLIDLFGLDPDRVEVAHTGVPEAFLDVPQRNQDAELHLIFLGNLSAEKAPRMSLLALDRLLRQRSARLRFVGAGPQRAELETVAASYGLRDNVEFTESVDDVRPHLAWADVLVLTSETEGFPGVVLEAAATATPTVAFDVGGTAETIEDGVTGFVVPPGDLDAFDRALGELATDDSRRRKMGEEARARVSDGYLIDHAVERYDQLLRALTAVRER